MGTHKRPFYRVVAADSKKRRDGRFIEILGTYNPLTNPSEVKLNVEKTKEWIKKGAQPTKIVKKILQWCQS
jgi:small subunit ribosomal protein S16